MNILITGGASGLGETITKNLAETKTDKIFFTYCNSLFNANELEKAYSNVKGIYCDFTDEASVELLASEIEKLDINVLVNNALTGLKINHFHKTEPEHFLINFKSNVMPVIKITQKAILHFRKNKSGKIVTVLSDYITTKPPMGLSEYVAQKNYLLSLSNSWAAENVKFNISSNCISPSFMQTGLTADTDERIIEEMISNRPDKKLLTTDETAKAIRNLVNAPAEVTGTNIIINRASDII